MSHARPSALISSLVFALWLSWGGQDIASAQAVAMPRPAPGPIKPFTLPDVSRFQLDNGMRATLAPGGATPTTTVSIRLRAGNYDEGQHTWIADITAALLADGTEDLSANAIAETASAMGGRLQTRVTQGETIVSMTVLASEAPRAVALLARIVRDPAIPACAFDREQRNFLRTLDTAGRQSAYQAEAALGAAYYGPTHPYSRILPTTAQLQSYTAEHVRAFHRARYTPGSASIYVGGRFDGGEMRRAIEDAFGSWSGPAMPVRLEPRPTPRQRVALVDRPGASQISIKLAYPAPTIDDAEDIAMRAANVLLSGAASSRIMRNIRGDKGYAYRLNSGIAYRDRNQASWVLTTDVNPSTAGAALTEIFREIELLRSTPPTPAETAQLQALMSGNFVLQNSTPAGLLDSMAQADLNGLPVSWIQTFIPRVSALAGEDIQAVAQKYLHPDLPTLVMVGDLTTLREQIATVPVLAGAEISVLTP